MKARAALAERGMVRVPLPAGEDPVAFAREAARRPGVEFAEPVYLYRQDRAPNDPRFKELWGLTAIDAPGAWATTVGDRRITVAVVDDGVALTHPDLAPNLWINPSEIAANGRDDDGDGYVDDVNGYDFVANRGDPSPARSPRQDSWGRSPTGAGWSRLPEWGSSPPPLPGSTSGTTARAWRRRTSPGWRLCSGQRGPRRSSRTSGVRSSPRPPPSRE